MINKTKWNFTSLLSMVFLLFASFPVLAGPPDTSLDSEPPLPRATTWLTAYGPEWQIEKMENGHKLQFMIRLSSRNTQPDSSWKSKYKPIFEKLREWNEPICLQWGNLMEDAVDASASSPVDAWKKDGTKFINQWREKIQLMKKWYPDPPYVLHVSNNEGHQGGDVPVWDEGDGDALVKRAKGFFDGIREGIGGTWGNNSRFIGYSWIGIGNVNLYSIRTSPLAWNGVSSRLYLDRKFTDHTALSPNMGAMNLFLIRKVYQEIRGDDVIIEASTWDKKLPSNKEGYERYGGMATWIMWTGRTDTVRHFASSTTDPKNDWPKLRELVEAADQIHKNDTLRKFWLKGKPVINPNLEVKMHVIDGDPAEVGWSGGRLKGHVPDEQLEYFDKLSSGAYHLPTSTDPDRPKPKSDAWEHRTEFPKKAKIPVWSNGQVMGEKPNRQWLIFTYAPLGAKSNVTIDIPDGPSITTDVPVKGKYLVVDESKGGVTDTLETLEIKK